MIHCRQELSLAEISEIDMEWWIEVRMLRSAYNNGKRARLDQIAKGGVP